MSLGASEPHAPTFAPDDRFGLRHAAFWLDRAIGMFTEGVGAVIVVVETCILFAGVVSRYVFDSPIIWTDELGNFLFLWLAMLGTVVALRSDGHMRLSTLVNWVRPSLGRWFASVGALVVVAFVLLILMPALQFVDEEQYVDITTLGISAGYSAVAILVGMSLAAIIAILRLIEASTWRDFGLAVLVVGGISLVLWLFQTQLTHMVFGSLFIFFVVLVATCVAIGVPIAFAFGISTM